MTRALPVGSSRLIAANRFRLPPLMLASVTTPAEARLALRAGADLIDAKDPSRGALGDLPVATVAAIAGAAQAANRACSATVGDLPMCAGTVVSAVRTMAASGVDYVKIGLRPEPGALAVIEALGGETATGRDLVAVLFADLAPEMAWVDALAEAGFRGVMLDTAGKSSGRLTDFMPVRNLAAFIARARGRGLFAGLAGSLALADIGPLSGLHPDILGFRGALCLDSTRTFGLSETLVGEVRAEIDARCGSLVGHAR